jgi:hypothetical protein
VKVALAFVNCGIDELKALLDGGTLTVYSVARPFTPDSPVTRSGVLATFTFASPAFDPESDGLARPTELWSRTSRQAAEIVKSNSAKSPVLTVPPLQSPSSKSCRMAAGPRSLSITRQGRVRAMPCRRTHEISSGTAASGRDLFIVGQMSVSRQQRLSLANQILLPYCDTMPAKSVVKPKNRAPSAFAEGRAVSGSTPQAAHGLLSLRIGTGRDASGGG